MIEKQMRTSEKIEEDLLPDTPVFVTGTQRSGTTLLHQILNASDEIWSKNEMWGIHAMLFQDHLPTTGHYQKELRRHLDKDAPPEVYRNDTEPLSKNFAEVLRRCAQAAGKVRWALKDPRLTYFLGDYAREFHGAKFLIVIRDPRAVCNSYLHSAGFTVGRPANAYAGACRWRKEVRLQSSFAEAFPDRTLLIRYEDLITRFPETINRIADFLQLNESIESMLKYHKAQSKVHAGNENIHRPPDVSILSKWKDRLNTQQQRIIEGVCVSEMNHFSYELANETTRIGNFDRVAYTVHDVVSREWRWRIHRLRQWIANKRNFGNH